MARFEYLLVMGLCVLVTLPLEVWFGARVWRRPRRLLIALLPALAVFVTWDLWAVASGTWRFDPDRTVGLTLPGGIPVEELVFFVVVPVCGLLTIESVRNVLAGRVHLPVPGRAGPARALPPSTPVDEA
ncbi:MAG TPA: lycopene cyclase domain-containing protein [Acidimicrobiales bacterium]|nr:lycopene cyclase domain-containing protein [Acidimicrobiales bacterium]